MLNPLGEPTLVEPKKRDRNKKESIEEALRACFVCFDVVSATILLAWVFVSNVLIAIFMSCLPLHFLRYEARL